MSAIIQPSAPAVDLHSPTAIGDVVSNTGAFTTLTVEGTILPVTSLANDIGSSSKKFRNVWISGSMIAGSDIAIGLTALVPQADGVLTLYNNAQNSFARLQFGGTTSSFPAIKRTTIVLQARLADDSAFAPVQGMVTTDTPATTGLTAGVLSALTTASIVVYDSTGQAYRVPCVI